jgi:hypothetical protein
LQKLKFYFIDKEKSFFSFDLKRIFIQLQPKKEFARLIRILQEYQPTNLIASLTE